MPRLGGSGPRFPIQPGGIIYEDEDDWYPIPLTGPIFRGPSGPRGRPRPPHPPFNPSHIDVPLPVTYPYPPTRNPQPWAFPKPPHGRQDHRQSVAFTPWILNLSSEDHKCADLNLFREPRPSAPAAAASTTQSTTRSSGGRRLGTTPSQTQTSAQGTKGIVVLPILPGPKRRYAFFDISVMTLSNVLYVPGAKYSELSWKRLAREGFTRHVLHNDHTHDVTHRSARDNRRQYTDGAARLNPPASRSANAGTVPRPGRNTQGGHRFSSTFRRGSEDCGRLTKECSVIRHPALPGIDLLWCNYDHYMDQGVIRVQFPASSMVDLRAWSWGVEVGVVGRGADFVGDQEGANGGEFEWVVRYGGRRPDEEPEDGDVEDLFRRIVKGGVFGGEEVIRGMEGLSLEGTTAV